MRKNKVSVVIPNYNGRKLLEQYLPSVFSSLVTGDEVVIVDDLSTDNGVAWLIKHFKLQLTQKKVEEIDGYNPDINSLSYNLYANTVVVNQEKIKLLLVVLETNVRFGASANTGVLFASHPLIFLLNNDVKVTKTATEQLKTHFKDLGNLVFAVGCLEYQNDLNGEKFGKNKLWFEKGLFQHSRATNFSSGKTAWASGGSAMFFRKKYLELKGFDKLYYPAYWEDIDLSFRAIKKGWQVLFDEQAVVFHCHETTNQTVFGQQKINQMSWENGQKFTWKNGSLWQKFLYLVYKPYWIYQFRKLK